MSSGKPLAQHTSNLLLSALSPEEQTRLSLHLEPVMLPKGKTLYEIGERVTHAYFITSGMASLLSMTGEGETVQVAMVGNEGVVGVPAILRIQTSPYRIHVQIPCTAFRVKAAVLNAEFLRGGNLQESLLRYLHALLTHVTQSAICNRYHSVEQRLCRWLLMTSDNSTTESLTLTQVSLADMIGAQRTGVTMTATALQRRGLINYQRGKIRILNRPAMESVSCECYQIIREQLRTFLVP
jgi:CRP-like cAMP-binding protein